MLPPILSVSKLDELEIMGRGKQNPAPPSLRTTAKSLCGSLRRAAARRGGEAVAVAAVIIAIAATHDVGACATWAAAMAPPAVAAAVAYQYFLRFRVYGAWPSAPFPTTLPLLGNAVVAAPAFMRFLLREAKKRDGLFLFWPGGVRPMCVVATPAAAKAVLGSSRAFPKGEDYRDKFGLVFGDGLVTSTGEKHARARRVLGKYFAKPRLEAHAPSIAAIFDSTADELWDARLADGPCDIDVQEFFHIATLRAFCSAMIGEDILTWKLEGYEARGAVAKYVATEVSFGSNVVGEHMLYNIPMSRAFPRVRRLAASCAAVRRQVFMPLIERRRAMVRAGAAPDDCLTALVASDGDDAFSDDDLLDQLVTLVGAGHDTSAYFCCYGALMLAKHPDVQARLRAELSEGKSDWPDSLLKRVVMEVLRLYPVIPMVTRQCAKATDLVDDHGATKRVPKGSRVLVPFFLMNRLPRLWGDDAAAFDPDRWLPHQRAHRSDGVMLASQGFLPFGYGGRTCIGYALALLEMRVFFGRLLDRYVLEDVPGFAPTIKAGVSLTVENPKGIKVRFRKRV